MRYLITGGCGFLGSNLAQSVLEKGEELCVFDNLSRFGSSLNLDWLKTQGEFKFIHGDIRNANDVETLIAEYQPQVIFHLAGQVAMTTSIENPRKDFEINAMGSFNLLEAVRKFAPDCQIIYSSTNKVYGDLAWVTYSETETRYQADEFPKGFDEATPLDFHSPYGVSKGSADQYMLDYSRIFGLNTTVFRHSSMYGGRQYSTYDQGWVGWFCQQAINIKNDTQQELFTISGTGKQVRDVLHAKDMKSLYFSAVAAKEKIKGQAFNIGGGMDQSLSLLELFQLLEEIQGITMQYTQLPERLSDQKIFVADISKASELLNWRPAVSAKNGVQQMLDWLQKSHN